MSLHSLKLATWEGKNGIDAAEMNGRLTVNPFCQLLNHYRWLHPSHHMICSDVQRRSPDHKHCFRVLASFLYLEKPKKQQLRVWFQRTLGLRISGKCQGLKAAVRQVFEKILSYYSVSPLLKMFYYYRY